MEIETEYKVKVIGSNSIPTSFLGIEGKVTEIFMGKAIFEFIHRVGDVGSLSYTVRLEDLKKVRDGVEG